MEQIIEMVANQGWSLQTAPNQANGTFQACVNGNMAEGVTEELAIISAYRKATWSDIFNCFVG